MGLRDSVSGLGDQTVVQGIKSVVCEIKSVGLGDQVGVSRGSGQWVWGINQGSLGDPFSDSDRASTK